MERGIVMKRSVSMAMLVFVVCAFALVGCKPKPKLMISKTSVGPGEVITVEYTTPKGFKENAWIGIIPSNIEHGNETRNDKHDLTYQYLKGSTAGKLNFTVPKKPGKYDFRMHDTDNDGMEVAFVTFEVVGATEKPAETAKTETVAKRGNFATGDNVMVEWRGSWWPAKVIKVGKGKAPYKIHYDGYSSSWDEWISDARIKNR